MELPLTVLLTCAVLVQSIIAYDPLYAGYKVYSVTPRNNQHARILSELQETRDVSFWRGPFKLGGVSTLMLSPAQQDRVLGLLTKAGLGVEENVSDVQMFIDQGPEVKNVTEDGPFHWNSFYNIDSIYEFLTNLTELHPDRASLIDIGETFEGRTQYVIKISKGEGKRAIFMDSLIHAREWVTGAVMTYFVNELLYNPNYSSWTDDFDFYLLIIANPDGYEYTYKHDRMWRKTRKPNVGAPECDGTDPNRNFPFEWELGVTDPCAQNYGGTEPLSEVEVANIVHFIGNMSEQPVFFGSVHACGNMILLPYGLEHIVLPPEEKARYEATAKEMTVEINRKFGSDYIYGSILDVLYPAAGSSIDWVKGTYDTYLTFAFELSNVQVSGSCSFIVEPEVIVPTAIEFMDGFQVVMKELRGQFKNGGEMIATSSASMIIFTAVVSYLYAKLT